MRIFAIFVVLSSVGIQLSACSSSSVSCDGEETTKTLLSIVKEHTPTDLLNVAVQDASSKDTYFTDSSNLANERDQCVAVSYKKLEAKGYGANLYCTPPFIASDESGFQQQNAWRQQCQAAWNIHNSEKASCFSTESRQQAILEKKHNAAQQAIQTAISTASKFWVDTIRVTAKNNDTGALICAARLNVEVSNIGGASQDISYRVEHTSDDRIYVTVLSM